LTFGSIFFGTMDILPTQKDAAQNLGRFIPARIVVGEVARLDPSLDPVLEVVLLVPSGDPLNQVPLRSRPLTLKEHRLYRPHRPSTSIRLSSRG
jgi:hypothetical protein